MKGVFKDSLVYMLGRGVCGIVGLWSIPLLMRLLGPLRYGEYSLYVLETMLLPQLTFGWLQQATLRFWHKQRLEGQTQEFRATQQRLLALTALFSFLIMLGYAQLVHHLSWGLSLGLAAVVALGGLQAVWLATTQADLRPFRVVVAELLRVGTPVILLLLGGLLGLSSLGYALFTLVCGWLASVIFLGPACFAGLGQGLDRKLAMRLVTFGAPMAVWFLLSSSQIYIVRLLLHRTGDALELGLYSGLQDLATKVGTVLLMPMVYAIHASGMALVSEGRPRDADRLIARAYLTQGGIILVGVLGWLIFRPQVAALLVGGQLAPTLAGRPWFGILVLVGSLLPNVGLLSHKRLEFANRTDLMVGLAFLALLAGTATAWGTVNHLGGIGSSLGLLVSALTYIVGTEWLGRRVWRSG